MRRFAAYARPRAAEAAFGLGACLLGFWVVSALPGARTWALARLGDAQLLEGRNGVVAVLPNDASRLLHAANEFGPLVACLLGLAAAGLAARRLAGPASLAATCLAFGLASPVCLALGRYGWSRGGDLGALLQALGASPTAPFGRAALAAVAALGIVLLLRAGLRRTGMHPVSAFGLPVCVAHVLASAPRSGFRPAEFAFIEHAPTLVAFAAAVSAWAPEWQFRTSFGSVRASAVAAVLSGWAPEGRRAPPPVAAAALCAAGLLSLATPLPAPSVSGTVGWSRMASAHWTVAFESEAFSQPDQHAWLAAADRRLASYSERLGLPVAGPPIDVRVARSERALTNDRTERGFANSLAFDIVARSSLLAAPHGLPEHPRTEPLLAMRRAWGAPASAEVALALARYAVGEFGGRPLRAAAARIACEEPGVSAAAALGQGDGFLSPLVRDAMGGAWAEAALDRHGVSAAERLYRGSAAAALAACTDCLPACAHGTEGEAPRRSMPEYLKGISFSHEGRGADGYGSAAARRELGRMRATGANAVALVPYAFTRAPDEASIRFRTLETDTRLRRAARQARDLGLRVMLKPHIWAGRRFHGSIAFESEERFEAWFGDYRRWMLHYARLAEMTRADILSIGNELAGLTVRESAWRSLVRDVRRIYRGPLTYGAHWESEVERIGFWDELDYIGVNFYYPIAAAGAAPRPDSPEIAAAARAVEEVGARFGKPVLFTEVGFPALATAAARPWEENGSALDPELQARCYEAWLEAFARAPNVKGMFWWKWPSHGRGSPFDPSHRPLAKPALRVLRAWFARL